MVFVGGRTSWTLIKWSTSLRINSSLVGAEIGTLQVAPASAQQIDGMVITSPRIWMPGRDCRTKAGSNAWALWRSAAPASGGGVRDAKAPGRSLALSTMRDWWPPRPRAGFPQDLVLDLGLQVVQNCLRRRTNVVDCDQVFGNPPHQLILRWSRNRNPAGCPCISSAERRHWSITSPQSGLATC